MRCETRWSMATFSAVCAVDSTGAGILHLSREKTWSVTEIRCDDSSEHFIAAVNVLLAEGTMRSAGLEVPIAPGEILELKIIGQPDSQVELWFQACEGEVCGGRHDG